MNDDLLERLDRLDGYTAGLRDLLRQIEEELEMIEAWKRSARHVAAVPSAGTTCEVVLGDRDETFECTLPKGHRGHHEDAVRKCEWTDADHHDAQSADGPGEDVESSIPLVKAGGSRSDDGQTGDDGEAASPRREGQVGTSGGATSLSSDEVSHLDTDSLGAVDEGMTESIHHEVVPDVGKDGIGWYISDTHARRAIGYLTGLVPELHSVPVPQFASAWAEALEKTMDLSDRSPIGPEAATPSAGSTDRSTAAAVLDQLGFNQNKVNMILDALGWAHPSQSKDDS